jgi:hypothetical protein
MGFTQLSKAGSATGVGQDSKGVVEWRSPVKATPITGDIRVPSTGNEEVDPTMNQEELTALFQKLGADDPEGWARSQIQEGILQLPRFLFLRQAWRQIVEEGDSSWIEYALQRAQTHPDEPYAGVGHALKKLRARGATDEELTDVVRGMQAQLLFSLCYLLEDPGDVEAEVADVRWALVQIDEEGHVLGNVDGLHESVLDMDPTGREMRPRGSAG